jgi:1-acyl-sn-glycerol-3-phosphate acyltransferase
MRLREAYLAVKQWGPFALRTAYYGSISVTLGPLTADHRASQWAMRTWCKSSAKALSIDVVPEGLENVPEGAFVYASNHQSIVDVLVLGSALSGDFKWAAKRSLMKIPFLGWHLRLAGHVPVDRGHGSRAAALVIGEFEKVLGKGKPLLIFPEGTRSETGALRPFKNGGFYAAVRANVPVVPVALEGTYHLMKRGKLETGENNQRTIRVKIGKPVYPATAGKEKARVNDLRDRSYAAVADALLKIGGRVATEAEVAEHEAEQQALLAAAD